MPEFAYQEPFPHGPDTTKYRHVTADHVRVADFRGHPILEVAPEALTLLAREAFRDVSFLYRASAPRQGRRHPRRPRGVGQRPRASRSRLLKNAVVASGFQLPMCQDTGTATVIGKKGQSVWTGGVRDEELHQQAAFMMTYLKENLRYSQTAPLTMYDEVNTGHQPPRADRPLCVTPGRHL